MNQSSPVNISTPVQFLFLSQPSPLESEMLTKTIAPDVFEPHQQSKDSCSKKAQVEKEPSSNDSTPKSPLEYSEPYTPTSHHQLETVITPVTASFEGGTTFKWFHS